MSTQNLKAADGSGIVPDKMAVFQECLQQFNALPVNTKKCRQLLAKLLRLIYQGEQFPLQESTTLFFSISKLFQHKDTALRQLVYLTIKELAASSQDILMVTSSIMKDIQSGDLIYKPNAIRTLSKVLDPTTVSASERLFRNCLVDKNPIVSSAALISSYNLLPIAKDVVKRFSNETLETIQSYKQFPANQFQLHEYYGSATTNLPTNSYMYQYHALGLLYQLRNHDKMSLMKLITSLHEGSSLKNSLSIIQLIRYINKVLTDDGSLSSHLYPILASFLKHKSDMVELEACKTLISLLLLVPDDGYMAVILTLQKLLTVPRTATRFAAVRLINKVSLKHPEKILVVNLELEGLINDPNRSVSTLAITTLLKTLGAGTVESTSSESVDRLISKMTSLMDEITEDFKVVIIDAIENLALKFPSKHKKLVAFLSDLLRDDGSLQMKSRIVEALFDLIKYLPDESAKQLILMNLCEFIEDCEFTELSVRILHLLGDEGPKMSNASYYIRHIYNRLVLENSIVRSSAVIALAKFAAVCEGEISRNVKILLSRCLKDVDDEVRDRATLSLSFIDNQKTKLIVNDSKYNLAALESKLTNYLKDENNFSSSFDISEVPLLTFDEVKSLEYNKKLNKLENAAEGATQSENGDMSGNSNSRNSESAKPDSADEYLKQQEYAMALAQIPDFADYGKLTKSSSHSIYLTDKENEFVVTALKHFFMDTQKLVIQYVITNTLSTLVLQDVSLIVQPDNALYQEDFVIPLAELRPDQTGSVYVSFSTPAIGDDDILAAFGNTISYNSKDVIDENGNIDPADEGIEDEYQVEDLEVNAGDFISPLYNSNFTSVFEQLPYEDSSVVTVGGVTSIESAVSKLLKTFNSMPLDGSDYVPSDTTSHVLKTMGKDVWGGRVGAQIRLACTGKKVVAKLQVKAETEGFAEVVANGAT
ncbi:Coatomer, gamma subunit [Metschnikowia bicuspidata var. bicuspidata NRRL YB-4993]|uniref:Coatomer subunit gamma n=1 Tax=Metschnikowia bicuspidata var. bicuspidata NRRL YB-4993 TaxID=869754 RepID=A0A1A0H7S7_9ASCO|nr:Coatomer, gamma subunit [Metschnikowia bicuspidata var. bicuspidata NRRL YB-4993]OBA19953.1 Coatomer, gamma subunit [Metschnikowia bicuspidata var. bicuspidata NRRL YB-4993]